MRRTLAAAALAAPLLCLSAGVAGAHNGPNTFGLKCGGWALHMFPYKHQHGPLFNYGPYSGYYPFEPYGPWDAYLRYQGGYGGGGGGNTYGWIHGWQPGSRVQGHGVGGHAWGNGGCSTCGGGHQLFHRHGSHGCNSCGAAAAAVVTSGPAEARYTGFGHAGASAAYYAETPSLIVPVGGTTAP
ncbi:hypothetical protein [Urbifossiella limnaea]|uniref:Uncharacterized protein n=1 Tax=Urbifossiella limnaea TaxID=2528023 RepID=A0A517XVT8_9BACT|nr:hypothetical protein [Urbifossiella limnaea]QDU21632.1 hypothetical protein ETAA1_36030 [Urbifossiella limnaea]